MIRIDDERGEMWCSSSILSFRELGWEREARRATPRRASLFISSESDPNPARTVTYSVQVQAPPDVPARSGEHL